MTGTAGASKKAVRDPDDPARTHAVDSRRRRLLLGAAAATSLGLPALGAAAQDASVDVHIALHAAPDEVALRPGAPTRVWRYRARLLSRDPDALEASAGGYFGPVIRVRRGQRVRIDLISGLPESTVIH